MNDASHNDDNVKLPMKRRAPKSDITEKRLKSFPGLAVDAETDLIYCMPCRKAGADVVYNRGAQSSSREAATDRISTHMGTKTHKRSAELAPAIGSMGTIVKEWSSKRAKEDSRNEPGMMGILDIATFIIDEDIALRKMDRLREVVDGIVKRFGYEGVSAAPRRRKDPLLATRVIADGKRGEFKKRLESSCAISVMLDECTDMDAKKCMSVYVRWVDESGIASTSFLELVKVPSSESEPLFAATKSILQKWNVWGQVVALGTDGASNMTGAHTGLGQRMQEDGKMHLLQIHCIAHRAALCMPEVFSRVPELSEAEGVVRKIVSHFSHSTKRYTMLHDFQEHCGEAVRKLHQIHEIRWYSRYATLTSIRRSAESLVQYFTTEEPRSDISAVIGTYHFQRATAIMCDVLSIMNRLSLFFQKDSIDLGRYEAELDVARTSLQTLVRDLGPAELVFLESKKQALSEMSPPGDRDATTADEDGNHFVVVDETNDYVSLKKRIADCLLAQLSARFPSAEAITVFGVFNVERMPNDMKDLRKYGLGSIRAIHNRFGEWAGVNLEDVLQDWEGYKNRSHAMYRNERMTPSVRSRLLMDAKDAMPALYKLMCVEHVLPFSTSAVERGFSRMNSIKNQKRKKLGVETCNDLMTAALCPCDVRADEFCRAMAGLAVAGDNDDRDDE